MHYDSTWDDADPWPEYPESDGKELDAFGGSYSAADHDGDGTLDLNEEHLEVSFTVTNPSGSLSATAGLGGRIQRIDVLNVSGVDEMVHKFTDGVPRGVGSHFRQDAALREKRY